MTPAAPPSVVIHLSVRSIVRLLGIGLLAWMAWQIPGILAMVTVSLILASAMLPAMTYFMERRRWPRAVAIFAVYGVILAVGTLLLLIVVPTLVEQAQTLAANLPQYTAKMRGTYSWLQELDARFHFLPDLDKLATTVSGFAAGWIASSVGLAGQLVGGVFTLFVVGILTFFLLLDGPDLKRGLLALVPPERREVVGAQFEPIALKLGGYVQGVGLSIGFLTLYLAIALSIAGVPLALVLALLAGCLEIIPLVGSLLGSIPAILMALTVSWQLALVVVAIFGVGNVLQGNVVAPFVFSRSIEVSPVMIMLALLVGGQIMGFAGALIAVPVMAALQVLVQNLYIEPMERHHALLVPPGPVEPPTPDSDA